MQRTTIGTEAGRSCGQLMRTCDAHHGRESKHSIAHHAQCCVTHARMLAIVGALSPSHVYTRKQQARDATHTVQIQRICVHASVHAAHLPPDAARNRGGHVAWRFPKQKSACDAPCRLARLFGEEPHLAHLWVGVWMGLRTGNGTKGGHQVNGLAYYVRLESLVVVLIRCPLAFQREPSVFEQFPARQGCRRDGTAVSYRQPMP